MLVVLVLSIIFFYLFSLAHFSKKIDGFRLCKRKPTSPEMIARVKYRRELMLALGLTPRSKSERSQIETAREDKPSIKDSFFADDPYIGPKNAIAGMRKPEYPVTWDLE